MNSISFLTHQQRNNFQKTYQTLQTVFNSASRDKYAAFERK